MDKTLAKKTDNILFVKIDNDGFDLGAQRRANDKNDLTACLEFLQQYKHSLQENTPFESDNKNVFLVPKETIAVSDYNLSIDRFRVNENVQQSNFEMVSINDVSEFVRGVTYSKEDEVSGNGFKVLRSNNINVESGKLNLTDIKQISKKLKLQDRQKLCKNDIFICTASGSASHIGKVAFIDIDSDFYFGGFMGVIRNKETINPKYLFYNLRNDRFNEHLNKSISGANIKNLKFNILSSFKIPLPPLSIQQQIVTKIEAYQKIIDGAKQVTENYKPQIDIDPSWEMVKLGEVCEINPKKSEIKNLKDKTLVSFVPMADINENRIDFTPKEVRNLSEVFSGYTYFEDNDVLVAKVTPCFENGKAGIANDLKNKIGFGSSELYVLRCSKNVLPIWIYIQITSNKFRLEGKEQMTGTGGLQRVPKDFVSNFEIPLPPLSIQQEIVNRIEQEQELVNANKQLIEIFEQKIKDEINKLWQKAPDKKSIKKRKLGV